MSVHYLPAADGEATCRGWPPALVPLACDNSTLWGEGLQAPVWRAAVGSQGSERGIHSPRGLTASLFQWENARGPVKGAPPLLVRRPQPSTQLLVSPGNREGLAPGPSSASCCPPEDRSQTLGRTSRLSGWGRKGRGLVLSASQGTSCLSLLPLHLPVPWPSPCNFLPGGGGKEMSRMMD